MAEVSYDDILLNITSKLDTKGLESAVKALEGLQGIKGFSGLKQASSDLNDFISSLDGITNKRARTITNLANALKGLGGARKSLKAVAEATAQSNPLNDTSVGTAPAPNATASAMQAVKKEAQEAGKATKEMNNNIKKSLSPMEKLANRFKSFLQYRMMRAVWSAFVNGAKEGVKNLEDWDRSIGHTGFAESMDRARESLLVLKNSLAVIVAPGLEALIGVLQKVATWAMTASNAISRFFAILGGKSTYRAVIWADTLAESEAKAGGSAKKATAEFKKQLMAFDEINNITADNGGGSGGGGGSGSGAKYTEMFEEKDVGELSDVEKKIKAVLEWLKKIGNELKPIFQKLELFKDVLGSIWESTKKVASAVAVWLGEFASPVWQGFKYVLDSIVGLFVSLGVLLGSVYKSVTSLFVAVGNLANLLGVFKVAGVAVQVVLTAIGVAIDVVSASVLIVATAFEQLALNLDYVSKLFVNLKALLKGEIGLKEFKQNMAEAKNELNNGLSKSITNLKNQMDTVFGKKYRVDVSINESVYRHVSEFVVTKGLSGGRYFTEYASGGFPTQGQLFVAREAGAELVGNIGGRTAVVNNADIVASVSQGVASAVASVLGGGTNVSVTLEGDAKGLFKVVQKEGRAYSARTGQPALA